MKNNAIKLCIEICERMIFQCQRKWPRIYNGKRNAGTASRTRAVQLKLF